MIQSQDAMPGSQQQVVGCGRASKCELRPGIGLCDECGLPKYPQRYVGYGCMVCLDCLDPEWVESKQAANASNSATGDLGALASANGYAAGAVVEVNIPGHRWHGLVGRTLYGGHGSHLIRTLAGGREFGPVATHELKPHNDPGERPGQEARELKP